MGDKSGKGGKMNKQEFLLNKPLLKEINTKIRGANSVGGDSNQ
jgi:hypothetical protein